MIYRRMAARFVLRAYEDLNVDVRFLGPVRVDDELRIEVALDRITQRSIQVHYAAFVGDKPVAEAGSRYVCLDDAGRPTGFPAEISRVLVEW